MIKCIFFDLDNTIYAEEDYYISCYKEIANMISPTYRDEIFSKMLEIRRLDGDNLVFNKIIELYGLNEENLDLFIEMYRSQNILLSPYHDVVNYLMSKPNDIIYGILTNGGEKTQKNKIRCLKISQYFDFIFITGEHLSRDKWKPNEESFKLIFSHTGYKPDECLYIGDSFEKDVVGALNTGMNAIMVDRNESCEKKRFEKKWYWLINSFSEIEAVIREIEG